METLRSYSFTIEDGKPVKCMINGQPATPEQLAELLRNPSAYPDAQVDVHLPAQIDYDGFEVFREGRRP